jgi:hypothetical protein
MLPMRARQWWYKYSDEAEVVPPATRLRNKRKRQEKQKQIFKECMEIMHSDKRRKNNQNSQHTAPAQSNQIPEPGNTLLVKKCHCGKDLLTNNDNTPMIQCDWCQTWLHISCTRLEPDTDLPETFFCLDCNTRALNAPRKRKRRKTAISMKIKNRIQHHQADPPTATWTCTSCTYELNNPDERTCGICHTKRPKNKGPVKDTWWLGRVLPANALQNPDNTTQPTHTTVTTPAPDIITRVQDNVKYPAHIPATTRKPQKQRTKPSAAARISLPAPTIPPHAETTRSQTTKPTTQTPTHPLSSHTLVPHPPTKTHCTQPTSPQKPQNKRKRKGTVHFNPIF